ncbi:putative cell division control protein [Triangularia verruculosa]|uniref:Cell division control protein n=1 Tax=Triangularia verruculosa TaxID=2587418 RepID=A0AAN6XEQ6_9PEZI|nr:putative cell division control protein [Triangularia verruculosa]
MASLTDPLLLFRQSIQGSSRLIAVSSPESNDEVPLSQATHLVFSDNGNRVVLPADVPTRFMSTEGNPIDLRSIYFAWMNRDITIPEYNAAAEKLNEGLRTRGGGKGGVHKFPFVERSGKGTLDPRLAQIYEGERRMGDRNSVLRGIKPTDFSHIRKLAAQFMTRKPTGGSGDVRSSTNISNNPSLALNQKPARRPDPIILLSPSASSLLRMSNAKAFLEGGRYTPPDHSTPPTMLAVSRIIKDIDPNRPIRFILVEGPENFKPEYWNRVVAVFTTGQAWQFKSYKWPNPVELFKHVQGVYLGWRGDQPPESVRAFGHKVLACSVEKWRDPGQPGAEQSRWRDREVVESIWKAVEANMRARGWKKDAAPTSI